MKLAILQICGSPRALVEVSEAPLCGFFPGVGLRSNGLLNGNEDERRATKGAAKMRTGCCSEERYYGSKRGETQRMEKSETRGPRCYANERVRTS